MLNKKNLQGLLSTSKLTGEACLLEKKWRRQEKEKRKRRKKSDLQFLNSNYFVFKLKFKI